MSKLRLIRSFIAIITITIFSSTAYQSLAAELKPLVVTGIALDRVASQHPIPTYPQEVRSLKLKCDVQVRIQVVKGKMIKVTAESTSAILAAYSSRWVHLHWQFKPSVSGVYLLPISYTFPS